MIRNRIRAVADAPARAYPVTPFKACHDLPCYSSEFTEGNITWYNRTAYISGVVYTSGDPDFTQAVFDAFAGATKIDSQTRTVSNVDGSRPFGFTIGDPNLVGGIDRIRVTICLYYGNDKDCGVQRNFLRP